MSIVTDDPVPDPSDEFVPPSPEQLAERARRADRGTRMALAGVLGLEAVIVLLVPRAIAFTTGLGTVRTVILITLAALLVLAAAQLRRPWGIAVGSGMQVAFLATGIMIAAMFLVGALFLAVWLRLLTLRQELVGGAGGLRMLAG
jgi:predicted nucleic acid-binding Zn ribbon protein